MKPGAHPASRIPKRRLPERLSEKEIWNAKYSSGSHTSLRPDPFLLQADKDYVQPLLPAPGSVLDLAGGVGRHAIFYAKRGWQATLLDVSEQGITLAQQNARRSRVEMEAVIADLKQFNLRRWRAHFDLVLVFFYLERKLFPALTQMLKPGGLLLCKTYLHGTVKGPTHPLHLLEPNELLRTFRNLRVLDYRETFGQSRTAEFVGRKAGNE
jgi:SAM-dependent methyltransferase